MEKVKLIGILFAGILVLGACSNSNNATEISKLKAENTKLKARNDKLNSQVSEYEKNGDSGKSESESNSKNSNSKNNDKTASINESVSFGANGKELIKLKVTKVSSSPDSFPDYMKSTTGFDTSKMIAVSIEYTNIAYGDSYLPYAQYFQAYTKDGKTLERSNSQNGQDAVADGRSGSTTIFFQSTDQTSALNEIEMDFMSKDNSGKLCTFNLPVSH